MTPKDLITAYIHSLELRAKRGAVSRKTLATYTQGIKTFVRTVGVQASVTTETYVHFLKSLGSVSPSSVKTYKSAVLDYYKFCHLEHGIEIDLLALREATKRYCQSDAEELPEFDKEAIQELESYVLSLTSGLLNLRDKAFIITAMDAGFRNFEFCKLTIGDVDFENAQTVIVGKKRKKAVVRFSPRSIQFIQEYLSARAELDSHYPDRDVLPLFARHDKSASTHVLPIGTGGSWAALKAICQRAGVDPDKIRVHDLRHYFVTKIYGTTHNLALAQELARHANIQTTRRYTHLSDQELNNGYSEVFG